MRLTFALAFCLSTSFCSLAAQADIMFNEDFTNGPLNSNLNVTDRYAGYTISGNIFNTGGVRNYVRTNDTDYTNFQYELTLTHSGFNSSEIAFIGIGSGSPEGFWREPGAGSLMMRIHNPGLAGGRVDFHYADLAAGTSGQISETVGNITSINTPIRAQVARVGDVLTMGYDVGFSGTYTPDVFRVYDLSQPQYSDVRAALNGNTSLFFGSQYSTSRFDDFLVTAAVPEPSALGLLSLAGIGLMCRRRIR